MNLDEERYHHRRDIDRDACGSLVAFREQSLSRMQLKTVIKVMRQLLRISNISGSYFGDNVQFSLLIGTYMAKKTENRELGERA